MLIKSKNKNIYNRYDMSKSNLIEASRHINPEYKHILEFGVWKGDTIKVLRDLFPLEYNVFGFDSFIGLPEDWVGTPCKKGDFSNDGEIPNIPNVTFYKGFFDETLPSFVNTKADNIALLHIDCDLYSSTKVLLEYLYPFIKVGTIIAFDEWYYHNDTNYNDHEQRAFLEFAEKYKVEYEFIPFKNPDPYKHIDTKILKITCI